MLFLFSDIGESDAPTRIRIGSHLDIARHLQPAGDAGLSHGELDELCAALQRPQALATGQAGDVYLCHPFLVHEPFRLNREDDAYSPVEIAIRRALQQH
jgi:hypothetical protein